MRVFNNSFAVATAVSVISLVIMLSPPVGAGMLSISAPAVTVSTVFGGSDCQEGIRDRECDSHLNTTDGSLSADSAAFYSLRMAQPARGTAGVSMTLSDLSFMASPAFEQTVAWIDPTAPAPVSVPAAPIMTQGLVLSADTLLDYAWTLSSRSTSFGDSSGQEKSVGSTAGVRHPTIHAAPEPDQLLYAAGAAAVCGFWQLRRRRPNPDRA